MDKYEYKLKAEEIKSLIAKKEYMAAVKIADTIDWNRVKSVMMLCTVSDLYKINRRFEESKELLLMAYERHPGGRTILYSLCELSIKMEEVVQAVEYYKEFVQIAPKDSGRYILQYKLYEAQEVSLEERIAVLEELKKRDYREKWAYELAYLYHRVGLGTKCVEECDELILWFGEGRYVIKAMELKMLHQPLSKNQKERYDSRFERGDLDIKEEQPVDEEAPTEQDYGDTGEILEAPTVQIPAEDIDQIHVKTVDVGQYNTMNIQQQLAASMKELLSGDEKGKDKEEEPAAEFSDAEYPQTEYTGAEYPQSEYTGAEYPQSEYTGAEYPQSEYTGTEYSQAEYTETEYPQEESAYEQPFVEEAPAAEFLYEETLLEDSEEIQPEEEAPAQDYTCKDSEVPGDKTISMDTISLTQALGSYDDDLPIEIAAYGNALASVAEGKSNLIDITGTQVMQEMKIESLGAKGVGYAFDDYDHKEYDPYEEDNQPLNTYEGDVSPYAYSDEGDPLPSLESRENILKNVSPHTNAAPRTMEKMIGMDYDGQLSFVVPEAEKIEKQITGQLSIDDILLEWEKTKKENEQKRKEDVRQRVLEQTGNMFKEFDEATKTGLLEQLQAMPLSDEDEQIMVEDLYTGTVTELLDESSDEDENESELDFVQEPIPFPVSVPAAAPEIPTVEIPLDESEKEAEEEFEELEEIFDNEELRVFDENIEGDEFEEFEEFEENPEPLEESEVFETAEGFEATEEPEVPETVEGYEATEELEVPETVEGYEATEEPEVPETVEESEATEESEVPETVEESEPLEEFEALEEVEGYEPTEEFEAPETVEGYEPTEEPEVSETVEGYEATEESEAPEIAKESEPTEEFETPEIAEEFEEAEPAEVFEEEIYRELEAEAESVPEAVLENETEEASPQTRVLTREEYALFGSFIQNRNSKDQIIYAVENMSLAAYTGNVIITGDEGMNTLELAKNLIRSVQVSDSNFSGKIAKISGMALNKKDVKDTISKLENGALIVEGAAGMNQDTADDLKKAVEQENHGIIVILEGSKKDLDKWFKTNPTLEENFNIRVDIEALTNDALVAFGRKYAKDKEYNIDEMGILALHTRIADMQTAEHAVTLMDVKAIVDGAIEQANARNLTHFFDILLSKRYDCEDMIVLRERDFM